MLIPHSKSDRVVALCETHKLLLPTATAHLWREGEGVKGEVPSLNLYSVRVLMTDGILAYLLLGDGKSVLFGHLANWIETKDESEVVKELRETGASVPRLSEKQLEALDND